MLWLLYNEIYRLNSAEQGRNILLALLHTAVILLLKSRFVPNDGTASLHCSTRAICSQSAIGARNQDKYQFINQIVKYSIL